MTVDRTSSDSTLPWRSYDCRQHCVGEYTAVEALGLSAIQCRIVHCRGGPVTLGNTVSDSTLQWRRYGCRQYSVG